MSISGGIAALCVGSALVLMYIRWLIGSTAVGKVFGLVLLILAFLALCGFFSYALDKPIQWTEQDSQWVGSLLH